MAWLATFVLVGRLGPLPAPAAPLDLEPAAVPLLKRSWVEGREYVVGHAEVNGQRVKPDRDGAFRLPASFAGGTVVFHSRN